jgi:D-alanyl-D-alanine carboxypeptidase
MRNLNFKLSYFIVIAMLVFGSCKKDSTPDQKQTLLDQMQAVTDSIIENTHVPGVVALVVDHKLGIDWVYTAGLSDIPNKKPMDPSYTFRIGSNTKTMTGTVLLQLVEEGKLELEDKLSEYFPQYPKADSVTIAMLCNMTSGIFNYSEDEAWTMELLTNPTKVWTPEETVEIGFSNDYYFSPGTDWHYSNTNTFLLGMIIEKLTGNSLEYEIENRIINPLQLNNTGFLTSGLDLPGTHGRGYYDGEYVENVDMTEHYDVSWAWAAGSAYATPRELQHYVETLVGGGFLSDEMQQKRLSEVNEIMPNTAYGLCLLKRGSFYGHNGGLPGFTSSMYHSNEKDCTVILYFNSQIELVPDYLFLRYMDILYGSDF